MAFHQTGLPQAGDPVATFKTNRGEFKVRLFPEQAPKTVENFVTHAKNGYYDGLTFHRVIEGFMIQGGDPTATGCGGESIWGHSFEDEFSPDLHNICGALSMANAGPNTNGSQFFLVQANTAPETLMEQMREIGAPSFSEEAIKNYETLGGTPWLDFKHTVFGQTFEGMDVVNAIAAVPVGANDKPIHDVVIDTIEISE